MSWSGLYNGYGGAPYASIVTYQPLDKLLNRTFRGSRGKRVGKAVILALTGSAVGANSPGVTYPRVQEQSHSPSDVVVNSGARKIETVTSRAAVATTSAELTKIDNTIGLAALPIANFKPRCKSYTGDPWGRYVV